VSNVGFATLTVIPSAKGFGAALGGEVNPAMSRAGADGGGLFGKSLMPSIGKLAVAAGGLFAAAGVGGFFKEAVQGAADLEQSIGAIETVFKGSSPQMLGWADSAATAVGLTKNEYAELGTLIGTQLKNGGTAMEELAPKTNDLIGLGADLSSMFGGSAADAVGALSSALKGERDPIERYGVSLNQAKIDAEAAALGFEKVGGTLSSEANQAATLSLIMKQTADAHGNFARETDTLSHKQQVLNAMWEDGKTRIGAALVPAISALMGVLISGLGPALGGAERGITKVIEVAGGIFSILGQGDFKPFAGLQEDSGFVDFLFTLRETVMSTAQAIGEAFGPYIPQIASAFSELIGPLLSILPALSPFGIILQGLLPVLPQIAALVGELAVSFGQALGTALTALAPTLIELAGLISGTLAAVLPILVPLIGQLGGVFTTLVPVIASVIAAVLPLVTTLISQLAPIFVQLVSTVLPPVVAAIGMIVAAVAPLITQIAGLLVPVIAALMPVVVTVFGVIANVVQSAMQIVQGVIQVVTGVISGNWGQVWDGIKNIVSGVWNTIKSVVSGALSIVSSVIGAALNVIRSVFSSAWNGLVGLVSGAWSGITGAISSGISSAVSFVSGLGSKILAGIGDLGSLLTGVGRNMIEGLIGGVQKAAGKIKDAVLGPIKDSVDAVKNFLGIHSPSRLFMAIGAFTGEGMAIGLQRSAGLVARASDALIPAVPAVPSVPAPSAGARAAARRAAGPEGAAGGQHFHIYESTSAAQTAQEVARRQRGLGA
jgi:phage-related protein